MSKLRGFAVLGSLLSLALASQAPGARADEAAPAECKGLLQIVVRQETAKTTSTPLQLCLSVIVDPSDPAKLKSIRITGMESPGTFSIQALRSGVALYPGLFALKSEKLDPATGGEGELRYAVASKTGVEMRSLRLSRENSNWLLSTPGAKGEFKATHLLQLSVTLDTKTGKPLVNALDFILDKS